MTTPSYSGTSGHEGYNELAAGWVLHSLEPDDEARFIDHLATCERCQQAVADYSDALAELSFATPETEPPASLGERIRAEVARDLAGPTPGMEERRSEPGPPEVSAAPDRGRPADPDAGRTATESPRGGSTAAEPSLPAADPGHLRPVPRPAKEPPAAARPRQPSGAGPTPITRRTQFGSRGRASRWLAAAAAVVVVGLGVGNVVQWQRTDAAQERADREAAALSRQEEQAREEAERRSALIRLLAQPGVQATRLGTPDGRTLGYVVVQGNGNTQVLADGLPRNDAENNQYVLWYIGADGGNPKAVAGFDVTTADIDPRSVGRLPSIPGGIKAFAVSIEPGRQVPTLPTKVLGSGTVES